MNKIIVAEDKIGRLIVCELTGKQTDNTIEIKNPSIINIGFEQNTGRMKMQLFPMVLPEIIDAANIDEIRINFKNDDLHVMYDSKGNYLIPSKIIIDQYKNQYSRLGMSNVAPMNQSPIDKNVIEVK